MNGKVPVMINTAEQTIKAAIATAHFAEADGAQGLMMVPPMRYRAGDGEVVEYFKSVARNTGLPIMIYNNPVDHKILVTFETFDDLLKEDNIQTVKESTRDTTSTTRIKNRFDDRPKIRPGSIRSP